MLGIWCHHNICAELMACIMSRDSEERGGKEGALVGREEKKQEREKGLHLLLSTTRFAFDVATVIFPSRVSISSQRAVSGSQQHGGENIEPMLPPAFESDIGCKREEKKNMYEQTVTPFCNPSPSSPLASFPSVFLSSRFSLLTTVTVSFSLSKNIVFLPRCKRGRNFDMCVTFSSARRGEESWGKSGVLMTAECGARVMRSAGICSTCIKLFTSKTHCLLPARAAERGGRMMEKLDELNIRKMECLREKARERNDKKREMCIQMGCLESKDVLLSLEK